MHLAKLVSFFCFVFAVAAIDRPRGVSLEKASFYQHDSTFHCLRDGKAISIAYVNDDYCDCDDGSDEPGTSACDNGHFYCENKPYKGSYLISSRVNDGVCDCCDGSDEYSGIISCPNTCIERYEQAKAQQESLRRSQAEGYKVKQEYMQQGKRAKDEKLSQLTELENEKEILNKEKEAAELLKVEAEDPETAALDDHKKAWELIKEERQKVKDAEKAGVAFKTLDVNQDGSVDYPELMNHKEFDIDSDGTVSEEEAKEYLEESEQVDLAVFTEKIWPNIKEIYKLEHDSPASSEESHGDQESAAEEAKDSGRVAGAVPDEIPVDINEGGAPDVDEHENGYNGEEDEDDDEEEEDEDDEDSAYDISDKKSDADVPEEEKEPEYSEETKRLIAVADEARSKFDEAERKLKDNERQIDDIKKYLELDFGPNQEFAALKGQCFEYTDREYTYRLCPFDKSTQKNKNGGIETSLGNWGKWHGPDSDKYDTMKYENGQGCWNGPSRSTHVNLHCGSVNEVTSASEPSRCEYQYEFTTPARCEELKPLELKDIHDEL